MDTGGSNISETTFGDPLLNESNSVTTELNSILRKLQLLRNGIESLFRDAFDHRGEQLKNEEQQTDPFSDGWKVFQEGDDTYPIVSNKAILLFRPRLVSDIAKYSPLSQFRMQAYWEKLLRLEFIFRLRNYQIQVNNFLFLIDNQHLNRFVNKSQIVTTATLSKRMRELDYIKEFYSNEMLQHNPEIRNPLNIASITKDAKASLICLIYPILLRNQEPNLFLIHYQMEQYLHDLQRHVQFNTIENLWNQMERDIRSLRNDLVNPYQPSTTQHSPILKMRLRLGAIALASGKSELLLLLRENRQKARNAADALYQAVGVEETQLSPNPEDHDDLIY